MLKKLLLKQTLTAQKDLQLLEFYSCRIFTKKG